MDEDENILNKSTYTVLENVLFSCSYGYELSGSTSAVCTADGLWKYKDETTPSCSGLFH